jgi:lipopolysaccharide export system protein LptA
VTVIYDRQGTNTDISRIDASGGVSVVSPGESARGEFAVYDLPRGLITVVGGVNLAKGENRVSGGRMVIDLNSGRSVVEGGDGSGDGRVSGHFTVSKRPQ